MAATIWYVQKTTADIPATKLRNDVAGCFVNDDDLETEANVIAAAETALGLPAGYFDSAVIWSAAGGLDTDGDVVTFGRDVIRQIA